MFRFPKNGITKISGILKCFRNFRCSDKCIFRNFCTFESFQNPKNASKFPFFVFGNDEYFRNFLFRKYEHTSRFVLITDETRWAGRVIQYVPPFASDKLQLHNANTLSTHRLAAVSHNLCLVDSFQVCTGNLFIIVFFDFSFFSSTAIPASHFNVRSHLKYFFNLKHDSYQSWDPIIKFHGEDEICNLRSVGTVAKTWWLMKSISTSRSSTEECNRNYV